MWRVKRIAALTVTGTISVMVAAAGTVPALTGLPSTPTVTTPTVTVPSTPITPKTTVTTPTVTTPNVTTPKVPAPPPKVSTPKVSTPKVSTPSVSTPKVSTPKVSTPSVSTPKVSTPSVSTPKVSTPKVSTPKSSGSSGSPVSKVTSIVSPAGGGGGGGGSSVVRLPNGSTAVVGGLTSTGTAATQLLSGTSGPGAVAGRGGAGGSTGNVALDALSVFGGPGSPGAAGGTGPGGGAFAGAGAASLRLPPTLSASGAKHLRATLELLDGCMSAIAPLDRQVLGMRAGSPGAAPLSRSQVASRLGVSTRQVRLSERRGLAGLGVAAEQTGCAGPVGGPFAVSAIGTLPLVALATTGGVLPLAPGGGEGAYVPARQAEAGGPSPLAGLTGNGQSGPAWLVILFTVLFSVSIAGLMRELRSSVGA